MQKRVILPALALGALAIVAPALAKTSVTRSQQVCEAAVKQQTPPPKSANIDSDFTRVSDALAIFSFHVRRADDTAGTQTCTVDRNTSQATLGQVAAIR